MIHSYTASSMSRAAAVRRLSTLHQKERRSGLPHW